MIREQKDQPRGNILIIDSSQAALHLLAGILSEQGYLVRPIMNGTDVYSAIKTEPPDLILLDVNLPDINGYEICKQLKEDEQTSPIPIIFISESDGNFEKARAFAMGGADYINKPYQVEEVLARIETHLNLYKLRQQLQKEIRERGQIEQSLKQTQNDLKQSPH